MISLMSLMFVGLALIARDQSSHFWREKIKFQKKIWSSYSLYKAARNGLKIVSI